MPEPESNAAVLDAPTDTDNDEPSFGEAAVESLDEITGPKPEDTPGTTPPTEPVKPEEKPAEEPAAPMTPEQITERTAELDRREKEIGEIHDDIQDVLHDPDFREFMERKHGTQQPQQGEPGCQVDDQERPPASAEGANDPLEGFEAETEGQEQIVEAIRAQRTQTGQVIDGLKRQVESLTAQLGNYEHSYNAGQDAQTDKEEADALEGLKAEYPDLIDGGEKQKALSGKAAQILLASVPGENSPPDARPLTIAEAFSDAAAILGKDGVADRARKQVEADAAAAAAAGAESPGGTGSEGPSTFRELALDNYAG